MQLPYGERGAPLQQQYSQLNTQLRAQLHTWLRVHTVDRAALEREGVITTV
jgi:hypothetical protein